jgi:dCMP deaminase
MDIAIRTAELSKDRRTKVGAVIAGPSREILSVGYNGFPMGLNDEHAYRHEPPAKYLFTEHAERNAIYHGARRGISLSGTILYSTLFPCADCARAIIQVGIKEVCFMNGLDQKEKDSQWTESFLASEEMLHESGVKIVQFTKGDHYVFKYRSEMA